MATIRRGVVPEVLSALALTVACHKSPSDAPVPVLSSLASDAAAISSPPGRSIDQLVDLGDPGWPVVERMIARATNPRMATVARAGLTGGLHRYRGLVFIRHIICPPH